MLVDLPHWSNGCLRLLETIRGDGSDGPDMPILLKSHGRSAAIDVFMTYCKDYEKLDLVILDPVTIPRSMISLWSLDRFKSSHSFKVEERCLCDGALALVCSVSPSLVCETVHKIKTP